MASISHKQVSINPLLARTGRDAFSHDFIDNTFIYITRGMVPSDLYDATNFRNCLLNGK